MKHLSAFLLLLAGTSLSAQNIFQRVFDCNVGSVRAIEPVGTGTYVAYEILEEHFGYHQGVGVVKYGADQEPIWNKVYTAPAPEVHLYLNDIATTSDGGVVFGGSKKAVLSDTALVVKLNGDGDVLWSVAMPSYLPTGASTGSNATVRKVTAAPNGDVLVAGRYSYVLSGSVVSRAFAARISAGGTVLWTRSYVSSVGPSTQHQALDVKVLDGGGLLLLGLTGGDGSWLARLQDDGTVVWSTRYSTGDGFDALIPMDVFATSGGYDIFLQTDLYSSDLAAVMHTNASGILQSARLYKPDIGLSEAYSVEQLPNGGHMLSCTVNPTSSFTGGNALLLVTDASGAPILSQSFGSDEHEYGTAVAATSDGGYFVGGGAAYEDLDEHRGGIAPRPFLVKTNAQGEHTCGEPITVTVADTTFTSEDRTLVAETISGWDGATVVGETYLVSVTVCGMQGIAEAGAAPFSVLPNPASDRLTIVPMNSGTWDHVLLDATGRSVLTRPRATGPLQLDVSGIAPGRYVLRSTSGMAVHSTLVLVVR